MKKYIEREGKTYLLFHCRKTQLTASFHVMLAAVSLSEKCSTRWERTDDEHCMTKGFLAFWKTCQPDCWAEKAKKKKFRGVLALMKFIFWALQACFVTQLSFFIWWILWILMFLLYLSSSSYIVTGWIWLNLVSFVPTSFAMWLQLWAYMNCAVLHCSTWFWKSLPCCFFSLLSWAL